MPPFGVSESLGFIYGEGLADSKSTNYFYTKLVEIYVNINLFYSIVI